MKGQGRMIGPLGTIRALCECHHGTVKVPFAGDEVQIAKYLAWRSEHGGVGPNRHGHNVQVFRTADAGPRIRYGCSCGATFSAPSCEGPRFFKWSASHRKHGTLTGEIC